MLLQRTGMAKNDSDPFFNARGHPSPSSGPDSLGGSAKASPSLHIPLPRGEGGSGASRERVRGGREILAKCHADTTV